MNEKNIAILEQPIETDILDWLFSHPDCDSIIDSEAGKRKIRVLAYSTEANANRALRQYRNQFLSGKEILMGMSKDGIASVI